MSHVCALYINHLLQSYHLYTNFSLQVWNTLPNVCSCILLNKMHLITNWRGKGSLEIYLNLTGLAFKYLFLWFCPSSVTTGNCHLLTTWTNMKVRTVTHFINKFPFLRANMSFPWGEGLCLSSTESLTPVTVPGIQLMWNIYFVQWINHSGPTENSWHVLIFTGRNRSSMHTLCLYKFYILLLLLSLLYLEFFWPPSELNIVSMHLILYIFFFKILN